MEAMIGLLDKAIDKYIEPDKELLLAEGVLTPDGGFIKSKLNHMTNAYAASLCLFSVLDMEAPYLFMQLPCREGALRFYIGDLIAAMKACIMKKFE